MILGTLLNSIVPLCGLVGLGYFAGRCFDIHVRSLATLVIYILNPAVYFVTIVQMDLQPSLFLLPLILFVICNIMVFAGTMLGRFFYKDKKANLIGMMSAAGNTGLFGLPLVLAVLGVQMAGICMLANIGILLAINSTGYYIGARGEHSIQESLGKVLKIPTIYVSVIALFYNGLQIPYPDAVVVYGDYFIGCWVILGMMMIGLALANEKNLVLNPGFLALTSSIKWVLWPLLTWGFIAMDQHIFFLFDRDIHMMLLIFALSPLPSTSVSFAATLNLHTGETAAAVLVSTILTVIYIPAFFWIFGIV